MESVSRISSMLETARDLTLEAAREASAIRRPSRPLPPAELKKLLDSRNEREVLEGMRRVIALSARPSPSSQSTPHHHQQQQPLLFSAVLKNIASPSLTIKKLVYIYLLQHAESEPDTALLAINTIQKTLSATDPHLRALALRTMSSLRIPVISQIVSLGIKRGVVDMNANVRRAAALAIPKCWKLDPSTEPQMLDYLETLLKDKQYYVASAAVVAFAECCPDRIEMLHGVYRSLVRKLVDMDEWGQLATLKVLTTYARRCFPRKTKKVKQNAGTSATDTRSFYDDEKPEAQDTNADADADANAEEVVLLDPDLESLLKAAQQLLNSRNPAVIVSVTRVFLALAPTSPPSSSSTSPPSSSSTSSSTYLSSAIGPLISLLRGPKDACEIALYNILQVALIQPTSFVRHATHFLVRASDAPQLWSLKLELLTLIFPHGTNHLQSLVLSELSHFARGGSTSPDLRREAVRAIGRCAQNTTPNSPTASRCLRLLLAQVGSPNGELVAESLNVVRSLIQADPTAHVRTVTQLAKHLDTTTDPQARASIIWLVGEFAGVDNGNNIAADVLRILAKGFADEAEAAKLQIVLLAAKVYVHHLNAKQLLDEHEHEPSAQETTNTHDYTSIDMPEDMGGFRDPHTENELRAKQAESTSPQPQTQTHPVALLWQYIMLLARYDTSYDLRDRARVFKTLLATPTSTQLASLLLLATKPVPQTPSPSESRHGFTLGSASLIVGAQDAGSTGLKGYEDLPEWVKPGQEPRSSVRDEVLTGADRGPVAASDRLGMQSDRLGAQAGATPASTISRRANGGTAPVAEKSLDDWLAESDNDGDDATDEEESETEEDSEEAESTEEESSEEEDEDEESSEESENGRREYDRLVK